MSSFVTKPSAPAPAAETPITGNGFFPDVDPTQIRADQRVAEAITAPRLRSAVVGAMITVGRDLAGWAAQQAAAGYATLADVPADKIDGSSINLALYFRAIGCRAKAELIDRIRDLDTTSAGDRKAAAMEPGADELRRDATYAVRDILGRLRTTVELI
jgi:hypothetical protein